MRVQVQYFDDCPNWRTVVRRLQRLRDGYDFDLELVRVASDDEARRVGFVGSPTVLIDGADPFPGPEVVDGLACRVFTTPSGPAGAPSEEQLREVLGG